MGTDKNAKATEFFSDRLIAECLEKNTRVCVGLDPVLARFPIALLKKFKISIPFEKRPDEEYLQRISDCIIKFNRTVIDAVCEHAVAVKPQSAHYERFGYLGIKALHHTVLYAREKGMLVILDGKRNDIGKTAKEYAAAYLGDEKGADFTGIPCDALTVNPYMGSDCIEPFAELCKKNGKGLFILVKTSNPSGADFQDLTLSGGAGETVFQRVALKVVQWGAETVGEKSYSSIGAVVGATHPEAVKTLRELMPNTVFLMPGYGAQGAGARDIADAFDENGAGAVINSSSGINYAFSPETESFAEAVEQKAAEMRDDINGLFQA